LHLKRLELVGFKTFAERTELLFGPGITAIVGPNGSGKSNLCDAVVWVLGEQSLRSLRSYRAPDVIFAGSDGRRPIGVAEVSLTLDNAEGGLPLDFTEVTVTRRVYRSGEGEYFINKAPVRLRDLQELFLDTGVGKEAYSIINQNQVDAVLSAHPEDRRALIEEAAGIQKYRHRKREALHKLEATSANLTRVADIIAELDAALAPLAEQSQTARRYRELAREQQDLRIALLLVRRHQLAEGLARNGDREQELEQEAEALRTQAATLAAREEVLRGELAATEERLEAARAHCQSLSSACERASGREALSRQALEHLAAQEQAAQEQLTACQERITVLQQGLAELQALAAALEQEEAALAAQIEEQEAALAAAEEQLRAAAGGAAELRSAYLRLVDELTGRRNSLAQCDSILRSAAARQERLQGQTQAWQQAAAATAAERDRFQQLLARLEQDGQSLAADQERHQAALEAARAAGERQAEEMSALRQDLSARQSRLAALVELEEAKEGYYPGVRAVLTAAARGELAGEFWPVADLVRVPSRYQQAVEVALGSALQDIVTPDQAPAEQAIELLKRTRAGRATFLPLSLLRPAPRLPARSARGDCLGAAVDLVNFEERFRPIFEHLLGRVLVAPDLEAALRLGRAESDWRQIVTLEGEVIHPSRAITGGSSRPSPLLGRRREIEDLRRITAALQADLFRAEAEAAATSSRLERERAEGQKLAEAGAELERVAVRHQADLRSCQEELARLEADLEAARAEARALTADCQGAGSEQQELRAAIAALEAEQRRLEAAMGRNEESLRAEQGQRDALAGVLLETRTSHAAAAARGSAAQATMARECADLAGEQELLATRHQAIAGLAQRRQELLADLAAQGGESARAAEALGAAEQAVEQARESRQQALDALAASLEAQALNRREQEEAGGRLHRLQLRSAQLGTELDLLHEQLQESYHLTPEQAAAAYRPLERMEDHKSRLAELEAEIGELGEVNLGAVEEYERVSGRLEFLRTQLADLEQAQADLEQVIAEIDRTSSARFAAAFQAVGEHFQQIFCRLFGGGGTSLGLTDPERPLEAGVEVHVTLPGKRPQNLLLLSGGERALTALAFLFALLRVKPSPFVVLDEIDAPLDEANILRFTDLLGDFADQSQFLVITHNKGTIEAADTIYGVTMEKPGISKLVSMRLADLEQGRSGPAGVE